LQVGGTGGHADWVTVSAGSMHTMGIREDADTGHRTLWAWGNRVNGRLGVGVVNTQDQTTPMQVGSATDWMMVSAGLHHTMGIREADNGDRTLWAWGLRDNSRLGLWPATETQATPIRVGNATDWATVSAGSMHTLGIRGAANGPGTLWAWGNRANGRLGLGNPITGNQTTPGQVGAP